VSLVLVTGANGFVGQPLCAELARRGYTVRAALRTARPPPLGAAQTVVTGDIGAATEWDRALEGVELIVHAAARTHVLRDSSAAAQQYAEINTRGTERLALAAVRAGVRRFVYLSSIKVNGEATTQRPYRCDDAPSPQDDYGRSKLQAEVALAAAAGTTMQAAIVRPPLVYGPGVQANFLRLMQWVDRRRPLPFGAVHNARSLVSVFTLNDLLLKLLEHPGSVSGVWLVADGEDLATPDLIRRLGRALGREVRLPRVPRGLLLQCGRLWGRGAEVARLCNSLQIDDAPTRRALDWLAPLSVNEALERTAAWYIREQR
jgi:nucleoside-diphosphate-sugar epimerase